MNSNDNKLGLSARDKTPKASGWGYDFHHTVPQRRVPCFLGDLLAPRSADDIPPITPEAMASVQAALKLLADLVADRDHNLFLGNTEFAQALREANHERSKARANDILLVAKGLAGILRVESGVEPESMGAFSFGTPSCYVP